jgi:hypothetical protein
MNFEDQQYRKKKIDNLFKDVRIANRAKSSRPKGDFKATGLIKRGQGIMLWVSDNRVLSQDDFLLFGRWLNGEDRQIIQGISGLSSNNLDRRINSIIQTIAGSLVTEDWFMV